MILLTLIVGLVVVLDQLTKALVLVYFPLHTVKEIIPGFFNLVHARNTGAAFSLLAGAPSFWRQAFFVAVTVFIVAIIFVAYRKLKTGEVWNQWAYALIIGGALGNLVDRIRLGSVVDFLDVYIGTYHWPAFNVADSGISVGAVMLLISLVRGK